MYIHSTYTYIYMYYKPSISPMFPYSQYIIPRFSPKKRDPIAAGAAAAGG